MCIALISTAHPNYPLILIDNRDEYLNRPTAAAEWWPEPNSHVLAGRDLLRPIQGTWLGVTKQGRIAVLTNFREEGQIRGIQSRGAMVNSFLKQPLTGRTRTHEFVEALVSGQNAQEVGGFSLVCGHIGDPLAIVSNRVSSAEGIAWVSHKPNQTIGLSNAAYGDRSWPKVVQGECLMEQALKDSQDCGESEDDLVERLLKLLSIDTLHINGREGGLETYREELRNSIFIPALGEMAGTAARGDDLAAAKTRERVEVADNRRLGEAGLGMSGLYGTQKQTVILVDQRRRVKFCERTLYDGECKPVPIGRGDVVFEFEIKE